MLNKPKFMEPSTNMQRCTIDLKSDKVMFSCLVDGNEAITAWQITVYNLSDGAEVLSTGKIVLSSLFFPVDEKNRNVVFDVDIKEYLSNTQTFINRSEAYCWTISFWGTSDSVVTSCEEVFYANTEPIISVSYKANASDEYVSLTDTTVISGRTCYFKGSYAQENNIQLKRYGWKLTDVNSTQVLIDTISQNQIYGITDNIACSYSGFLNNGKYAIELYMETQNNVVVKTEPITFSVSYNATLLDSDVKVSALNNEPAIIIDWNEAVVIGGRSEGTINFKPYYPIADYSTETPNTSVEIADNSKIIFDYGSNSILDIEEGSYIVLSTQLLSNENTVLFCAEGQDSYGNAILRKLSYDNGAFKYVIADGEGNIATATYVPLNKPTIYTWYIIIMSPEITDIGDAFSATLTVVESIATNGTYPSATQYPSASCYPSFGKWNKLKGAN